MRPVLLAVLTLVAAVVLGIVLFAADRDVLGAVAMLGGIPVAFVVWLVANER
ncbi:MAG: hypothetical protein ACRC50_04080 [Gaiella sp.]